MGNDSYYRDEVNELSDEIREREAELLGLRAQRADIATRHQIEIEEDRVAGVAKDGPKSVPIAQSSYELAQYPSLDRMQIDDKTRKQLAGAGSSKEALAILEAAGYQAPRSMTLQPNATNASAPPEGFDPSDVIARARNASSSEAAAAILREAGITAVNARFGE